MSSPTSKAALRSRIRTKRASAPAASEPSIASVAIDLATELRATASTPRGSVFSVLAYAGLPGEPDLDPLIDHLLDSGARVFLPVVTRIGSPLRFGAVTGSMSTLKPRGRWGIREPEPELDPAELLSAEVGLDLALVPALGFGSAGARLGNGGGFYDRTFGPSGEAPIGNRGPNRESENGPSPEDAGRSPVVIGVCFAAELDLPGLSSDPWDLRVRAVITETGMHEFA